MRSFSILSRIGGVATQLSGNRSPLPGWTTFSILSRIGGVATTAAARQSSGPGTFSILSRIGGVATSVADSEVRSHVDFQYPQSDRRRCNRQGGQRHLSESRLSVSSVGSEALQPSAARSGKMRVFSFSILSRIGGVATWLARGRLRLADATFQYPQSDRRRCNAVGGPGDGGADMELSVSSVGSEALQPDGASAGAGPPGQLSVSSVGSEALQLVCRTVFA